MAQSTGSNTYFAYVVEATPGTTPASPVMKSIPIQTTSLNMTRGLITDPSLRSDRMKRFSRQGNRSVGGNVVVSYSPDVYDDLLAASFHGAWASNVLKIGSTQSFMSVELGHLNVAQYRSFVGCTVNEFTLNVNSGNQLVTAEFAMMGMNGAIASTSLDANGVDAPAQLDPFVHLDGVFNEGGSPIGYMTGLQLKIGNQLTTNYAAGSAGARSITPGMANVTGQITGYFESAALYEKWLNETASSLSFTLTSGTKSQAWSIPNVKYTASTIPVANDGPIIQTLTFEGLYNAGISSIVQVTRVV